MAAEILAFVAAECFRPSIAAEIRARCAVESVPPRRIVLPTIADAILARHSGESARPFKALDRLARHAADRGGRFRPFIAGDSLAFVSGDRCLWPQVGSGVGS